MGTRALVVLSTFLFRCKPRRSCPWRCPYGLASVAGQLCALAVELYVLVQCLPRAPRPQLTWERFLCLRQWHSIVSSDTHSPLPLTNLSSPINSISLYTFPLSPSSSQLKMCMLFSSLRHRFPVRIPFVPTTTLLFAHDYMPHATSNFVGSQSKSRQSHYEQRSRVSRLYLILSSWQKQTLITTINSWSVAENRQTCA
jgi:hypothetical protein